MTDIKNIDIFALPQEDLNKIPWIQTFSGKRFQPLFPELDSICIEDIARALSKICRFNGHIKNDGIYSVAQHSIYVSLECNIEDGLHGLLHDASEAYIGDWATPIKRSGRFDNYIKMEKNIQEMIYKKFDLDIKEPESVKMADKRMLATEARD
jgi:5'-deoxynucleotidase YfbR-like HD superfamily hydrolase